MIALRASSDVVTRGLRSDDDYEAVAAITDACRIADGYDTTRTADQFRAAIMTWTGFDPAEGVRLAVDDGQVVGFAFGACDGDNPDIGRILHHGGGVLPAWRGRGIGRRLLAEAQVAARHHAARHPGPTPRTTVYRTYIGEADHDARRLLEADGYEVVRYGYSMVRPTLADPPSADLPPGLECRPATPANAMQIAHAMEEAFEDHWGFPRYADDELARMVAHPLWGQLDVWQVAWDGDEVAGGVCGFINEEENLQLGRTRGYTENIFTRRPWRGRGVATALIGRNLRLLAERGMTEAALSVDSQNQTGALALYERVGFERVRTDLFYQRPI
jgi:GNAT superfamily N-acetyltransferase